MDTWQLGRMRPSACETSLKNSFKFSFSFVPTAVRDASATLKRAVVFDEGSKGGYNSNEATPARINHGQSPGLHRPFSPTAMNVLQGSVSGERARRDELVE